MPIRGVETTLDLSNYQYAKLIARSALNHSDGERAKKQSFGFINAKFKELQSGKILWSDMLREDLQFIDAIAVMVL